MDFENDNLGMQPEEQEKKKKKGLIIFWIILIGILVLAILGGLHHHYDDLFKEKDPDTEVIQPFDPVPMETTTTAPGETTQPTTADDTPSGNRVNLTYTKNAKLHKNTNVIDMDFRNPTRSTHSIRVSLFLVTADNRELLIGSSNLIDPGFQQNKIQATSDVCKDLAPGTYKALYKVAFYETETKTAVPIATNVPDIALTIVAE